MVVGWYVIEPPETGVLQAFTKKVTAAMSGEIPIAGTMFSPQIPKLASAMLGFVTPAGGINATLPKVAASIAGAQAQSGSMASTLPRVSATMSEGMAGPMASSIRKVQASLSGVMVPQGGIASTMSKVTASLAGAHVQSGTAASTLRKISAAAVGSQIQSGGFASTLRKVSSSMVSQAPVTFDAVGAGGTPATVGFNPSLSTSWNQVMSTTGANLCCMVTIVSQTNGLAGSGQTRTVFFGTTGGTGGTAMTSVVFKDSSAGSEFFVEIFYILTSLTGTRQITATVSGGGNTGRALIANSVSYYNVGAVILGGTNSAGASPLSVSSSSAINEQIIAAFAGKSAITPTGSNNTRYNQQASGDISNILIQDSPGTGSTVNFGGTNASGVWAGAAARLQAA